MIVSAQPAQNRALMVIYDLRTRRWNYDSFYAALKQQGTNGWWSYLSSAWLIITNKSPELVYDALAPHISTLDRVLVIQVSKPAFGYLPKPAWDWINSNLP